MMPTKLGILLCGCLLLVAIVWLLEDIRHSKQREDEE